MWFLTLLLVLAAGCGQAVSKAEKQAAFKTCIEAVNKNCRGKNYNDYTACMDEAMKPCAPFFDRPLVAAGGR